MPNTDNSASVDLFLDELLKTTRTCTHTHTCNPPGPDLAVHTHTCYHTHTRHSSLKPRRPKGNREAVRKYREKKKAHTAYLEEEVKKLRLLNQQLVRKLQGQAILEAEVARLRGLLAHLKAKIDDELGIFPFQKQCDTSTVWKEDDCGNCHLAIIDCQANRHDHLMNADQGQTLDAVEAMVSSASQAE
ncbi:hypothetical protein Patl1_17074 [Pistacia atlantica]|uniref:Uncharacterized protein n=1 Tax=Pistacia atlantica TaxID=434234 RepID=A0ACC1B5U6_9ROSI|nr:hypothetical protein Patl1_17074 [Pistacia atlantica]